MYRHVKTEFKLEPYLLKLSRDVFRYIVKLRCSNHKLAIETGRCYGIDRTLRYCDMCNLDVLGDEYHVFFECVNPDIVTLRQQCIPRYYLQNPSMFKLIQLLKSSDDVKIGKRISMFIKNVKLRNLTILYVCITCITCIKFHMWIVLYVCNCTHNRTNKISCILYLVSKLEQKNFKYPQRILELISKTDLNVPQRGITIILFNYILKVLISWNNMKVPNILRSS